MQYRVALHYLWKVGANKRLFVTTIVSQHLRYNYSFAGNAKDILGDHVLFKFDVYSSTFASQANLRVASPFKLDASLMWQNAFIVAGIVPALCGFPLGPFTFSEMGSDYVRVSFTLMDSSSSSN